MALKVYLAGPDVFLANAVEVGRRKQELCREFGFEGLFPLEQHEAGEEDAMRIFQSNCALMRQADMGMINLTPFRGPSADPGTVFELGFLFAQGKRVYGYASGPAVYVDRVEASSGPLVVREGRRWDRDGYAVEEFALSDNLMIAGAIREAGGTLIVREMRNGIASRTVPDEEEPLAAFEAFEACLRAAADDARAGQAVT
jgi:nucleoside 2-deoxyribosyltransferase